MSVRPGGTRWLEGAPLRSTLQRVAAMKVDPFGEHGSLHDDVLLVTFLYVTEAGANEGGMLASTLLAGAAS